MRQVVSIIIKAVLLAVLVTLVGWGIYKRMESAKKFDYSEVLDEEVFRLDGDVYTFRNLAFFIAYEERVVEEEARIYNKKSTKDYWNLHTNGSFISVAAKDAVLDMAVHDNLMYNLALEAGVSLTKEQQNELSNTTLDFWMDLLDGQKERLLACTTKEAVDEILRRKAVGEVYQESLAVGNNHAFVYYDAGGDGYEEILKDHELTVNKDAWKRFVMGDITLHHGKVSYATGYDHE